MINYDDLVKMWVIDSNIDSTDLMNDVRRVPELHAKYYKMFIEERMRLKKLTSKKDVLVKDKSEYYGGSMDIEDIKERNWPPLPKMIMKTDIQKHIDADKEIIELNLRICYSHDLVAYLEDVINNLKYRTQALRLTFDIMKFQSGG